ALLLYRSAQQLCLDSFASLSTPVHCGVLNTCGVLPARLVKLSRKRPPFGSQPNAHNPPSLPPPFTSRTSSSSLFVSFQIYTNPTTGENTLLVILHDRRCRCCYYGCFC
ncbi:unnamed protein product, partial [Ectocarpus fasciculatus]